MQITHQKNVNNLHFAISTLQNIDKTHYFFK